MKPKVILFAGPIGSSKSPIANYLSFNIGYPIFNRDIIRTEVREDLGKFDKEEFEKRSKERLLTLIEKEENFILDASIDRKYERYSEHLNRYNPFLISIDISRELLDNIYEYKGYTLSGEPLDRNYQEHKDFVSKYSNVIDLSINDENFEDRLEISLKAVEGWLAGYSSDG